MIPNEMLQEMSWILLRKNLEKNFAGIELVKLKANDIHSGPLTTSKDWDKVQLFLHIIELAVNKEGIF